MTTSVSDALRDQVRLRAHEQCEYCLIADNLSAKRHEIDHIHAEKHNGVSTLANLCLSCYYCNRHKGSDLCSIDTVSGDVVNLFHPRIDQWHDHFAVSRAFIEGKTPIGRVTVELFQMNTQERIAERQLLIHLNRYP